MTALTDYVVGALGFLLSLFVLLAIISAGMQIALLPRCGNLDAEVRLIAGWVVLWKLYLHKVKVFQEILGQR